MTVDWKSYWDKYVRSVSSDEPLRQVLRVQNKQPISDESFRRIASRIVELLALERDDHVLDLCCGNGLISAAMSPHCRRITAVDFSERLVADISLRNVKNLTGIVSDALTVSFEPGSFQKILFAAALQHFTQAQVITLLSRQYQWLKSGGRIVITDIPDSERIWQFFNTSEREADYFRNTMQETPIIGTWFHQQWIEKLARYVGFQHVEALSQPEVSDYSHYRFDLLCVKG